MTFVLYRDDRRAAAFRTLGQVVSAVHTASGARGAKDNRDPQKLGEELLRLAVLHRERGTFFRVDPERVSLSMVADYARGTFENHIEDYGP